MQNLERDTLIDTLLESLETERYLRLPLLLTVIDELSAIEVLASAVAPAETLRLALERRAIDDVQFARSVRELRFFVNELRESAPVESGIRPRVLDVRRPSSVPFPFAAAPAA
jgi:hypothetical protein